MKKILWIVVVMCCAAPSFAQLEQGQHMFSLRGGLGFQLQNSGIVYNSSGSRTDWGTLGAELGLSYYYLVTDHFGIGTDFSYGDYEGADITWSATNTIDDGVHMLNLMLSARYTLNPSDRVRLYVPFGIGCVAAEQKLDMNYYGTVYSAKQTQTKLGYFAGLGLEFDLGHEGWSLGLESRYNAFRFDSNSFVRYAPAPVHGTGKRLYEYLTFSLSIKKRY